MPVPGVGSHMLGICGVGKRKPEGATTFPPTSAVGPVLPCGCSGRRRLDLSVRYEAGDDVAKHAVLVGRLECPVFGQSGDAGG